MMKQTLTVVLILGVLASPMAAAEDRPLEEALRQCRAAVSAPIIVPEAVSECMDVIEEVCRELGCTIQEARETVDDCIENPQCAINCVSEGPVSKDLLFVDPSAKYAFVPTGFERVGRLEFTHVTVSFDVDGCL